MRISLSPDVIDLYVAADGSSAAMVGTRVLVLPPLPALLVELVKTGPRDLAELVGLLVDAAGPPEDVDATDQTRRLVDELARDGLLRLSGPKR